MSKPSTIEEVLRDVLSADVSRVDPVPRAITTIKRLISERDTKLWYIVTEFGGDVVMGGFETKDLALEVRQMIESQTINKAFGKTYAIEQRQTLEKVMGAPQ